MIRMAVRVHARATAGGGVGEGSGNGIFDCGEFDKIDSVGVTIRLLEGSRTQTYPRQVDLRNQNQN